MKKILKMFLFAVLFALLVAFCYFFIGRVKQAEKINWGVNFSQKYAKNLGLDWKEVYSSLLDDMMVKKLKIAVHWDVISQEESDFNFEDIDWQINEAQKRDAKVVLVIGMKTSRWPECHIPSWAKNLSKEEQQEKISEMLKEIVSRYGNSQTVAGWQVENEPFFPFGECPWTDKEFLKEEVKLVKQTDPLQRPVMITDSGEGSLWINSAKIGDVVGTTMYKKVWFTIPSFLYKYLPGWDKTGFYVYYPFPPTFYGRKAEFIDRFFGKKVICAEFQAEPWSNFFITETSLEEQNKTMNLERFKANVEFAKKTGLDEFYIWGAEWMYWMKTKQNMPEIWNEAKNLFQQ
jgi:hypothetical protein